MLDAVNQQSFDPVELLPEVEPDRADRGLVPQAYSRGHADIGGDDLPFVGPDVARVDEQHAAQFAPQQGAELRVQRQETVPTER